MLETLTAQGAAAFWDRLEKVTAAPGWCGCYLMRTGSGALRAAPAVRDGAEEYLAALHAGFAKALAEAALPVPAELAAMQCVALLALISQRGAVAGFGPEVRALTTAGRKTCGV